MATPTNNRHGSAVSFTRSRGTNQQLEEEEDDDIQISLAPYIQSYLAQSGHKLNCCGVCLPIPFERAAQRSWWNPRFDSEILEGQYRRSSFPQVRLRFQYSLFYILTMCLSWFIYFVITGLNGTVHHWVVMASLFAVLLIITAIILILTQTNVYFCYTLQMSSFVAIILCVISLSFTAFDNDDNHFGITPMGQFSLCIEILLIIYTVIPLPLYICFCLGILYSILFECLSYKIIETNETKTSLTTLVRILLHFCVHLIGIHILIMTNVRMRGTFMKVGQSLLVRRQLEIEKQLKEKMIHSVMPPKVAAWLISEGRGDEGVGDESLQCSTCAHTPSANGSDIRTLFRPFNMHRMENVSILFADIVGFTRMSSNKSAEELVGILNDLFERFDELCATYGCEKISTLGDCYYCVAGCPEPKPDHAKACIEMGLGMICAIKEFDAETNEGVNMRVGVHTGTVLCGIVGTKRFKFDVWSNDVSLANQMESTGKPGRVHLSQTTAQFLEDAYLLEEGSIVQGLKTYFVIRHKSDTPELIIPPLQLKLSPSPQPRIRVHSCLQPGRRPHYLQLLTGGNFITEGTHSKACSLPSILDSDNDEDNTIHPHLLSTSPISLTSPKGKSWCYTKGLINNTDEIQPLGIETSHSLTHSHGNECLGENGEYTLLSVNVEKAENLRSSKLEVPSPNNDDQLSVCVSVNSRKDSGIRSNSRRSSIQQQIFVMNGIAHGELLTHRVSGYYTSSQSSLNEEDTDLAYKRSQLPSGDNFGICLQKLRKQSDLQLIRCVQDNVTSHRSYFVKPPLCGFTLFFRQKEMEKDYRTNAHRITENSADTPPTLATSRFNTYFDILISALIYFGISASLFLLFKPTIAWVSLFIIGTLIEFCAVLLCTRHIIGSKRMTCNGRDLSRELIETFSSWYPWHVIGAILVSLPIISVLVNFDCLNFERFSNADLYYSYLVFIGLVHFCNFTQLNCWMKSFIATWSGICYVSLAASHICPFLLTFKNESQILNQSLEMKELLGQSIYLIHNESNLLNLTGIEDRSLHATHIYSSEIFIDVLLLLILVWFLNREFEISYRLSFHGNIVAARDKAKVQNMKNQADQLLHNIIPKHVADQLKNTAKYSQNHHDVGIIFASIVNFNEMYDESYLGGKEYLRVLNELISDFDELLTKQEFKNVEKIKTIGSTFMAASGLNPEVRKLNKHPYQHLVELMDFAIAMQKVIDEFNRDLLEFNLVLRVGYNFGDVTAGVIGTTKLYYDIWGDAVNIASRMDSTGVRGHIQVGNNCIPILSEFYEFEYRGSVYVKGKDNMNVFLLKGKKDKMNVDNG